VVEVEKKKKKIGRTRAGTVYSVEEDFCPAAGRARGRGTSSSSSFLLIGVFFFLSPVGYGAVRCVRRVEGWIEGAMVVSAWDLEAVYRGDR